MLRKLIVLGVGTALAKKAWDSYQSNKALAAPDMQAKRDEVRELERRRTRAGTASLDDSDLRPNAG